MTPSARGWRINERAFATLTEAALALPDETAVHLALPADAVLLQRLRLPAINREELEGMMRLQLEKTLPFAADEMTGGLEIIAQTETESIVLAVAVSHEQLAALCAPLRQQRRVPEKITLYAMQVAAACLPDEITALIYAENDKVVFAVSERGKLCCAQTLARTDAADFFAELPRLLLMAELDGVPTTFARVRLDRELAGWEAQAREVFGVPVDSFKLDPAWPEPELNLVPASWHQERRELARAARLKTRLIFAGAIYLALLLVAAGAIFWMQHRLTKVDTEVRALQPQIELIAAEKAKWTALAPAIEPSAYPVEILLQIILCLPSPEIRLTQFDQSPAQFMIEAEAPTADLAVEFGERLKKSNGLKDYTFQISPPVILPNEHAQLRIFGKL